MPLAILANNNNYLIEIVTSDKNCILPVNQGLSKDNFCLDLQALQIKLRPPYGFDNCEICC